MLNRLWLLVCVVLILSGLAVNGQDVWASARHCEAGDVSCLEEKSEAQSVIKISAEAIKNYGIKTQKVGKKNFVTLPRSAFAASQNQYFVYAVKDGTFIELDAHQAQTGQNGLKILNEQLFDEFVIEGAKYLRMISLSQQAPVSGHSH